MILPSHIKPCVHLLAVSLLISCSAGTSDYIDINFKKALQTGIDTDRLCGDADTVSLVFPRDVDFILSDNPRFSVSGNMICIIDGSAEKAAVFHKDGTFSEIYDMKESVVDFFLYKGRYIELLTVNGIREISLETRELRDVTRFPDGDISYTSVARRDSNNLWLTGVSESAAFDIQYVLDKDSLFVSPNPICSPSDMLQPHFFQSEDSLYCFYPGSSTIVNYTSTDFIWPTAKFRIRFPEDAHCRFTYTNVQKNNQKYYIQFQYGADEYILVYDISDGNHFIVKNSNERNSFHLGIISDGINYVLTNSFTLLAYPCS